VDERAIFFNWSNLFYQQTQTDYRHPSTFSVYSCRSACTPSSFSFLQNFCTISTQVFWCIPLKVFSWILSYQAILGLPPILTTRANCITCVHSSFSSPSSLEYPNSQTKSRHPNSLIYAVAWYLFLFLPDIISFTVLSQTFSHLLDKVIYNVSKENFLTCTFVRYLVVHLTDTEPSVHMYWSDIASQTVLQLPRKDSHTSSLLNITTDGTRYTEHTADLQSNRA